MECKASQVRTILNTALPCALALALIAATELSAQAPANADDMLARIGARIAEFYERAKSVVCTEISSVQPVDSTNSPVGFVRTVESELHIETGNGPIPGEAEVVRNIRKVNGRIPRDRDRKDRAGCTDPNPLSSEPLTFLLAPHRAQYQFRAAGTANIRGKAALIIDFESVNRRSDPVLIADPGGRDDCFDWSGHIASSGRIWVDAVSYDVLRIERRLRGPVDVRVPLPIQRRHRLDPTVVIMRDDLTIRYTTVAFSDPDEMLLLPESIDSFTMIRGGLQSTRRHQRFSEYRRFVTGGRIVIPDALP